MNFDFKKYFDIYLRFVRNICPKPAARPVIGIDVGTAAVKAVKITASGNSIELIGWSVERIEDGDVKKSVKNVIASLSCTPEDVLVSSVSGKGTLVRYLDMPQMPIEDLRKSFAFELDKYFPFDPSTIYSDCAILENKSKEKKMSVLVVAVKKEIIDDRMAIFKDSGVGLGSVTLNSIALANAFDRIGPDLNTSGQAKAVLDIGGTVSSLLVIQDKSPRFTRDIFIGSQEMTQQIANILGMDAKSAEQIKCSGGDNPQLVEACEAAISNLVGEIRLSLDYFMTEKNILVDELYLLGGGSMFKGIEGLFEKNLGMVVKVWDPLAKVKLSQGLAASDVRNFSPQLGVSLGLGLAQS